MITVDLRAQVRGVYGPTVATAAQADPVFDEPIGVMLVAGQLPPWLKPGSWVHAAGTAHFCADPLVCAVQVATIEPIPEREWGGAEWVGAEEVLAPHWISTRARVMTEWQFYDEPLWDDVRGYGYTAEVALPQGPDGTRAVLHYHVGDSDGYRDPVPPPPITMGYLPQVDSEVEWQPSPLSRPLPVRTPIISVWSSSNIQVVQP